VGRIFLGWKRWRKARNQEATLSPDILPQFLRQIEYHHQRKWWVISGWERTYMGWCLYYLRFWRHWNYVWSRTPEGLSWSGEDATCRFGSTRSQGLDWWTTGWGSCSRPKSIKTINCARISSNHSHDSSYVVQNKISKAICTIRIIREKEGKSKMPSHMSVRFCHKEDHIVKTDENYVMRAGLATR